MILVEHFKFLLFTYFDVSMVIVVSTVFIIISVNIMERRNQSITINYCNCQICLNKFLLYLNLYDLFV